MSTEETKPYLDESTGERLIAEGLRTAIVNPYRVLSPGGESNG